MEQQMSMDIMEILNIVRKRLNLILTITILSALISAVVSYFVIKPVYQAQVSIIVGLTDTSKIDPSQTNLYQNILNTYVKIAKSKVVAKNAEGLLNDGTTAGQLMASTQVTQDSGTQLLIMTSTSLKPAQAYKNLQAMSEAFITESARLFTSGKTQIMDKAEVPGSPIKPDKKKNIALAALVGLMVSVGIAFLMEYLDRTIKTEKDIENYINIPLIGVIPKYVMEGLTITMSKPKAPASEAYKTLRTNIQYSSLDNDINILAVTSAGPGEGKTVTSCNIAVVLAQFGHKVLLVDADMRRPSVHKVFNISNKIGLSNLLIEDLRIEDTGINVMPNLDILTSGTIPPNPSEVLASHKMTVFLSAMEKKYDSIIIDTPPVIMVTDAQVLATKAEGVMLVVCQGEATIDAVKKAKELLTSVNANVLGAVLNKVEHNGKGYGYYNYYYYGHDEKKKYGNKEEAQSL